MGDGHPLSAEARRDLLPGLREHPTTHVFLAWRGGEPVGLAIGFLGFSTFAARPLLNLHDFYVASAHRGAAVGRRLLAAVEQHARTLGCCKLTLEVLEHNERALRLYTTAGFAPSTYVPAAGRALFYAKRLGVD